jgi:hypothetical protein
MEKAEVVRARNRMRAGNYRSSIFLVPILATKVFRCGVPHLLMVSVEHVPLVRKDQHAALTLMGGFDPPD